MAAVNRRMKVGVWLPEHYVPESGGAFSYQSRIIWSINNGLFDSDDFDIVFIGTKKQKISFTWKKQFLTVPYSTIRLKVRFLRVKDILSGYRNTAMFRWGQLVESFLIKQSVSLLYYPSPSEGVGSMPFVTTCWDIGHRSTYPFPEIGGGQEFVLRDNFYTNKIIKAMFIIAESETGKQELVNYASYATHKVRVAPMFPGDVVEIVQSPSGIKEQLESAGITPPFFMYPAQFWAHKNHANLLRAFKMFIKQHKGYQLVLCGSDKGNLTFVLKLIEELGLQECVLVLGFISNQKLNALYRSATALIMPTFLGPTNMPLLEAMYLGCPIICSDLLGHREILGEAGLYVDPLQVSSIYDAMSYAADDGINRKLREILREVQANTKFNFANSILEIQKTLCDATIIISTWRD